MQKACRGPDTMATYYRDLLITKLIKTSNRLLGIMNRSAMCLLGYILYRKYMNSDEIPCW